MFARLVLSSRRQIKTFWYVQKLNFMTMHAHKNGDC